MSQLRHRNGNGAGKGKSQKNHNQSHSNTNPQYGVAKGNDRGKRFGLVNFGQDAQFSLRQPAINADDRYPPVIIVETHPLVVEQTFIYTLSVYRLVQYVTGRKTALGSKEFELVDQVSFFTGGQLTTLGHDL